MKRLMIFLALLAACDSGGEDNAPVDDAEPRPEVDRGIITRPDAAVDAVVDATPPDMAIVDLGVEGDLGPRTQCNDGLDNDRDGRVDFPDDPDCADGGDDDEAPPMAVAQCADGLDNDEDGELDLADSDCNSAVDVSEAGLNPATVCSNGTDDDGDGLIDFPFDPGCFTAGHTSEGNPLTLPQCANQADDDGNGQADFPNDPGCMGAGDQSEAPLATLPACANGQDDDQSGTTDWPDDLGCDGAGDLTEVSPCGAGAPVIDLNAHLEANAHYDSTLVDAPANLIPSCGSGDLGERVFVYEVEQTLDRLIFNTVHPETLAPVIMYLRDQCGGADLDCDRGTPDDPGTALIIEAPPVGARYFLVVDTGNRNIIGNFRLTVDAVVPPQCRDGVDNDGDDRVDLGDPGCTETEDADELDPEVAPVCANDLDDDGDGLADWPADPDCAAAGGDLEAPPCGLDIPFLRVGAEGGDFPLPAVDGAGQAQGRCEAGLGAETVIVLTLSEPSDVEFQVLTAQGAPLQVALHARTDCQDSNTEVGCRRGAASMEPLRMAELGRGTYFLFAEQGAGRPNGGIIARVVVRSAVTACNDEIDNDQDGLIDLADPGCERGRDENERDPAAPPQCADGIDNDRNGQIDWPNDDGCVAAGDPEETPPCRGQFFGDVCVVHVSEPCVGGSSQSYCQMNGGLVITFAEFQAIVMAGWMRRDGNYHTVAVSEYNQCPGDGFGNVGIPGWGQFNLFQCGENVNYCNRAIICVTR